MSGKMNACSLSVRLSRLPLVSEKWSLDHGDLSFSIVTTEASPPLLYFAVHIFCERQYFYVYNIDVKI
jgi:hypothetical protein